MANQTQQETEMSSATHRKMNAIQLGLYSLLLPNVWMFAAQTLIIGIYAGGLPPLLYGTLIWGFVMSLQCLSFAEYASIWPSSAGCALIATKLGGERYGRFSGFATGYMHFLAGLVTPAALLSSKTYMAASIGSLVVSGYQPKTWQLFLMYQLFNILCSAFCIRSSRWLDRVATIGGICLFAFFFVTVGLLLGRTNEFAAHRVVWLDLVNVTGWGTGFAVFIGASLPLSGFGPTHWMLNMAGQAKNPSRTIPITLLLQQVGNISLLFVFFLAIGYGLGSDWNAILESPITTPIATIYSLTIRSTAGAVVVMIGLTMFGVVSIASYMNATTRLMHGFAITGAVPYSQWLSRYDTTLNEPINVSYLLIGVNTVLGLLLFVTDAVINTLVGAAMTLYFVGYMPVFVAHIITGGQYLKGKAYFRLPKMLGIALACFNIGTIIVQVAAFSAPPVHPITVENMNWAALVTGVCIISLLPSWILYGKSRYNLNTEPGSESVGSESIEGVAIGTGDEVSYEESGKS